jgi:hypothetical protein
MYLQQSLADNAGTICPAAVSLKDLIAALSNIEDMLKGAASQTGESPAEYLERFLNSPAKEPLQ